MKLLVVEEVTIGVEELGEEGGGEREEQVAKEAVVIVEVALRRF